MAVKHVVTRGFGFAGGVSFIPPLGFGNYGGVTETTGASGWRGYSAQQMRELIERLPRREPEAAARDDVAELLALRIL